MRTLGTAHPPEGREILTATEWRSLERSGSAPAHALIRRYQGAEVRQLSDEEMDALDLRREASDGRAFQFVISTESEDRYRDTIAVNGWDTANFLRGGPGPVLWCHDYWTMPVAKSPAVRPIGPALVADAIFPTRDLHPMGYLCGELYAAGYMKAVSVGFDPQEWKYDEKRSGYDFLVQELLEFSCVNVPANPEALIVAAQKGLDLSPLDSWARAALDHAAGEAVLPIPKAKLEALVKALGFGRGVRFFDLGADEIRAKVKTKVRGDEDAVEDGEGFSEGDRVRIKSPHMDGHEKGTIATRSADAAYSVSIDGMDGMAPHKWYVDSEMEPLDDDADEGKQVEPSVQSEGDGPATPSAEVIASLKVESPGVDELRALVERAEAVAKILAAAPVEPVVLRVAPDPVERRYSIASETVVRAMERAVSERLAPLEQQITAVTGRIVSN